MSTVLLYPLDLVKVRLQVNENSNKQLAKKRTMMRTLGGVLKHEGFFGIYQGLSPAVIGSAASWGGYFFFYEGMKTRMIKRKRRLENKNESEEVILSPLDNFGAACLSGAIMVGFTNPLWLIKTRMQLQMKRAQQCQSVKVSSNSSKSIKPPYQNMADAFRTIAREEGVMALYKGSIPALMLVSNGGIQFMVYEGLKRNFGIYTKASRGDSPSRDRNVFQKLQDSLGYLTMGAGSKIIASTMTYPIQLIKSRLQQRNQTAEITADGEVEIVRREYKGVIDCVRKINQREGFQGFFKGAIPNAIRVAPSSAITFVVYESVTDFLTNEVNV